MHVSTVLVAAGLKKTVNQTLLHLKSPSIVLDIYWLSIGGIALVYLAVPPLFIAVRSLKETIAHSWLLKLVG